MREWKRMYFIRVEKKIKICAYVKERGQKRYVRAGEREGKRMWEKGIFFSWLNVCLVLARRPTIHPSIRPMLHQTALTDCASSVIKQRVGTPLLSICHTLFLLSLQWSSPIDLHNCQSLGETCFRTGKSINPQSSEKTQTKPWASGDGWLGRQCLCFSLGTWSAVNLPEELHEKL